MKDRDTEREIDTDGKDLPTTRSLPKCLQHTRLGKPKPGARCSIQVSHVKTGIQVTAPLPPVSKSAY